MTTLYLDRRHISLKAEGDAVAVYDNKEGRRISTFPLHPLERIVMRGDVELNSSLISKLCEMDIGVLILSGWKNEPTAFMSRPHNDASIRIAQYKMFSNSKERLGLAKEQIARKLNLQCDTLNQLMDAAGVRYKRQKYLDPIQAAALNVPYVRSEASLRGTEGQAAKSYFAVMAKFLPSELGFNGRNRRPPRDPVNSTMSLCYELIRGEFRNELYMAGLDPYIGFLHKVEFGRDSLSCDLMESLRPEADAFLIRLFTSGQFGTNDFVTSSNGCLMKKDSRMKFYKLYETEAGGFRDSIHEITRRLLEKIKGNVSGSDAEDPKAVPQPWQVGNVETVALSQKLTLLQMI